MSLLQVSTTSGEFVGKMVSVDGVDVYRWLGVPYAQSTAGKNRFRKPRPITEKQRTMAQEPRLPCPQLVNGKVVGSEDCLHMNVWAPNGRSRAGSSRTLVLASVSYWFQRGSNNDPDWAELAAKADVVVMSPNMRLGVLGFLHPNESTVKDVAKEDAKEAVKWAVDNAAAFGARPDGVVLVGHGSGAYMLIEAVTSLNIRCTRAILEGPVPGALWPINMTWGLVRHLIDPLGSNLTKVLNTYDGDGRKLVADLTARYLKTDRGKFQIPETYDGPANDKLDEPFPLAELWNAINDSNRRSAPGGDTITYTLLGNMSDGAAKRLLGHINRTWETSLLPMEWKEAQVKIFFDEYVRPLAVAARYVSTPNMLWTFTLSYFFPSDWDWYYGVKELIRDAATENQLLTHLALYMGGCDTRSLVRKASVKGFHYMTDGAEKQLFEPILDMAAVVNFIKDGSVPMTEYGDPWEPWTSSKTTRMEFEHKTEAPTQDYVTMICELRF
ncbi:uncharacterized protein LOC144160007 [Haemaphysalis longicornis]